MKTTDHILHITHVVHDLYISLILHSVTVGSETKYQTNLMNLLSSADAVFAANGVWNSADTCSTLTCIVNNTSSRVHVSSNCVGGTECAGNNT